VKVRVDSPRFLTHHIASLGMTSLIPCTPNSLPENPASQTG
jgi:hypothetical protein